MYAVSPAAEDERIRDHCGLVLHGDGHWFTVAWFLPEDVGCWSSEFDVRQSRPYGTAWGVARSGLRKVMKIGDHTLTPKDADHTLTVYRNFGLLPGDLVAAVDVAAVDVAVDDAYRIFGMTGRYLLSCHTNGDRVLCEINWPELEALDRGHDSAGLRPLSTSGWRIAASNLRRVND